MALPATSEEILDWSWDDYAPHYEALATTELMTDRSRTYSVLQVHSEVITVAVYLTK